MYGFGVWGSEVGVAVALLVCWKKSVNGMGMDGIVVFSVACMGMKVFGREFRVT